MNYTFFIVGGVIFSFYVGLLCWAIFTQHNKQKNNKSELDIRKADVIDMDGHGNWGRFVPEKQTKKTRKKIFK